MPIVSVIALGIVLAGCGGGGNNEVSDKPSSDGSTNEPNESNLRFAFVLNDTGVTYAAEDFDSNSFGCFSGAAEWAVLVSQQDCSQGVDAGMSRAKIGGGRAGFDFNKINSRGDVVSNDASEWDCVRDNTTNLLWARKEGLGLTNFPDGRAGTALAYVSIINGSKLCGRTDWRMPTLLEALSIVDYGVNNYDNPYLFLPLIDTNYFARGQDATWTSHQSTVLANSAWSILGDGMLDVDTPRISRLSLRPVSGLKTTQSNRFLSDTNADSVVDQLHGLVWKRCTIGQSWNGSKCMGNSISMNWQDALRSGGYYWRIPNVKELSSLINPDFAVEQGGYVDKMAFPGIHLTSLWTSTPTSGLAFDAIIVDLFSAQIFYGGDRSTVLGHGVLLVRSL